jgi:hypothetical protein
MTNIEILEGFLSIEECSKYINFIDNNIDNMILYKGLGYPQKRYTIKFGRDDEFPDEANFEFSKIDGISQDLNKIFNEIIELTKYFYKEDELYLTSFFLSKHLPGSYMGKHYDADPNPGGQNHHLDYNIMLYLNTLEGNGEIVFPKRDLTISPKAGDLVFFDSKDLENLHAVNEVTENRYSIPIWLSRDKTQELVIR